jgi:hypothetical protein
MTKLFHFLAGLLLFFTPVVYSGTTIGKKKTITVNQLITLSQGFQTPSRLKMPCLVEETEDMGLHLGLDKIGSPEKKLGHFEIQCRNLLFF